MVKGDVMKHSTVIVAMTAMASSIIGSAACSRAQAAVPVVFDGTAGVVISSDPDSTGKYRWEGANWTKNGTPGQTAVATMGDNNGGQGGVDITIGGGRQVYYDINRPCPSTDACVVGALGDFKPRMDVTPGGSLTVKEGSLLSMVSKTDNDGRWNRIGLSITLDNGTWRNSYTSPSNSSKI